MNFLERMRGKPRHVKGQYALLVAALFTGAVASLWAISLPAKFSTLAEADIPVTEDGKSGLTELFDSVRDQLGSMIESTETGSEIPRTDETGTTPLESLRSHTSASSSLSGSASSSVPQRAATTTTQSKTETASSTPPPRVVQIATTSSKTAPKKGE